MVITRTLDFYCTAFEKQAKRWALTKQPGHFVSVYEYTPNAACKGLSFPSMTEEWLDFVVACRRGVSHDYDIVEGPMADDTIWGIRLKENFESSDSIRIST